MAKAKTIKVKSGLDNNQVALWERHADHPDDGETYVAGDKPVEVAPTPRVNRLLREGVLVKVGSRGGGKKADDGSEGGGDGDPGGK